MKTDNDLRIGGWKLELGPAAFGYSIASVIVAIEDRDAACEALRKAAPNCRARPRKVTLEEIAALGMRRGETRWR